MDIFVSGVKFKIFELDHGVTKIFIQWHEDGSGRGKSFGHFWLDCYTEHSLIPCCKIYLGAGDNYGDYGLVNNIEDIDLRKSIEKEINYKGLKLGELAFIEVFK